MLGKVRGGGGSRMREGEGGALGVCARGGGQEVRACVRGIESKSGGGVWVAAQPLRQP
jgi:hypothetical protein